MEWQTQFDKNLGVLKIQISKGERDIADNITQIEILNKKKNDESRNIGKQHAEAEVLKSYFLTIGNLVMESFMLIGHLFFMQTYRELEKERDEKIQTLFHDYNLGTIGSSISHEVARQMTQRAELRLKELLKDIEDKKVACVFCNWLKFVFL